MVCSMIIVTSPVPIVQVLSGTVGFTNNCNEFASCTNVPIADLVGRFVTIVATVRVSNANAKFNLKIDYTLDGVAKTQTTGLISQVIGDTVQCVSTNVPYAVGTYTALVVTPLNIVAG